MSLVDDLISSGEIEEMELANCKSRACKKAQTKQIKPQVSLSRTYKAKITPEDEINTGKPVITDEAIYVK